MKCFLRILFTTAVLISHTVLKVHADDGYRLWLRYDLVSEPLILRQYNKIISGLIIEGSSPTLKAAGNELGMGLNGLLGKKVPFVSDVKTDGIIIAGTPENSRIIASLNLKDKLAKIKDDGYIIINTEFKKKKVIVIAANKDIGVLYGTFHFLRLMQTHQSISNLAIEEYPRTKIRILNHWDNLNGSVERGYAGRSIWNWNDLPRQYISTIYRLCQVPMLQ